ncbi:methionine adenosyltransferase [Weissella paramesenteroides]|jgi:S-adenosylmethionine synthetase|uniref:S-adenosylmethionine synthase n=3 Tax=Weissella paramesenteroides TaxID=1249 RepID=C5RB34_WEIPA|nr:methionine adenosyltransferase [Weissella paramesenteroides]ATF41837.1 methionine adenosyltransferase [Weissella paramesenteroides]EER74703.1 methionine adenosyltransferase [Weissella paramesenteroides ATCC 33313]KAA8439588.1 methionine adenosyltransferase [Weissella paramesenteroides]KAA8441742.1 methionine adenosyltransferase [Weissella paramesenteroides]KAA8444755.1 methionine adenosyltransferase [Weissella paramesenteroides]
MSEKRLFTSESVSEGHPDKVSDQISDAILDAVLKEDPQARTAVETSVTTGYVNVFGEVSTTAYVNINDIVRKTLKRIGYDDPDAGFLADDIHVGITIDEQSPDIAQGVDSAIEQREDGGVDPLDQIGAGDQGLMFGFATNETDEYLPLSVVLSHKLVKKQADVRRAGILDYLLPDAKAQVTVELDENDKPIRIDTVVLSTQHRASVSLEQLRRDVRELIIKPILPADMVDDETRYLINPTGRFVIGGPKGDAGMTGRKVIVDTYGGYARHGGGAFSGKDATKVDRSAAYATRHIAKNIVAAGLAEKVEIQVAYAIGVAAPVSVNVNTFGTGKVSDDDLVAAIRDLFELRPAGIIEDLDLRKPRYEATAAYGHFGRPELDLPWERLDKVDELKAYFNK